MNRLCLVCFSCLIFCASGLSQDGGIIQCGTGMDKVPSWTGIEAFRNVVDYLSCGQEVNLVSLERGFWRVDLGGKVAYVEVKYVREESGQASRVTSTSQNVTQKQAAPSPITSPQPNNALTNQDVIKMVSLGF